MKQYRHAVSALVLKPSDVCSRDGCGVVYSLLLVHKPRKRDAWQLPQGGVEAGETESEAALRELQEEAGLTIDAVRHVSTHTYCYDFPPEFLRRHKPVNHGQKLCFVVTEVPTDTRVTVDNREIDSFAWILPEELPRYIRREPYLNVVRSVLAEYLGSKSGTKGR